MDEALTRRIMIDDLFGIRLARRKKKRRQQRQTIQRIFFENCEFDWSVPHFSEGLVKVRFRSSMTLRYFPERRLLQVSNNAFESPAGWMRIMYEYISLHEAGHALDFNDKDKDQRRADFATAVTGIEPNWSYVMWDGVDSVPAAMEMKDGKPVRRIWTWFGSDWEDNLGEFFADCFVKAFSDYPIYRPSNSPWQFTDDIIDVMRGLWK